MRCIYLAPKFKLKKSPMAPGRFALSDDSPLRPQMLLTALGWAVAASFALTLVKASFDERGVWWTDWLPLYAAAEMVADGQGDELYDLNAQKRMEAVLTDGRSLNPPDEQKGLFRAGVIGYYNAPLLAVALRPFTTLGLEPSWTAWTLVSLLMLAPIALSLFSLTRDWSPAERRALLPAILSCSPLIYGLLLGQISVLMAAVVAGFATAWRAGRVFLAGATLSLLIVKPQLAVYAFLALVFARQWRAVGAVLLGVVVSVLATLPVIGVKAWGDWPGVMLKASNFDEQFGVIPWVMYNVRGTLWVLTRGSETAWINPLTSGLFLVGALAACAPWLWAPKDPREDGGFDARLGWTLLLSLPLSPHLYRHDAFVAVVPVFFLYNSQRISPRWATAYGWFIVASIVVLFLASTDAIERMPPLGLGPRLGLLLLLAHAAWAGLWLFWGCEWAERASRVTSDRTT